MFKQVRDTQVVEFCFRIKKETRLKKLMDAYCSRIGAPNRTECLALDGYRLTGNETPLLLGMKDLDCIDTMMAEEGGPSC